MYADLTVPLPCMFGHILITFTETIFSQVSQYTFAMCSYKEKKSDPTEMTTLDGHTIDYTEPVTGG
jgi:hypothetical protein